MAWQEKMEQLSIDEKSLQQPWMKKGQRQKSLLRLVYRQKLNGRPYEYDLCINSSRLGIEATAEKTCRNDPGIGKIKLIRAGKDY